MLHTHKKSCQHYETDNNVYQAWETEFLSGGGGPEI